MAPDGRWLRINRRLAEILGRGREELLEGGPGPPEAELQLQAAMPVADGVHVEGGRY